MGKAGGPRTYDEPTVAFGIRVPKSIKAAVTYQCASTGRTLGSYVLEALADKLTADGLEHLIPDLSRRKRPNPAWSEEAQARWRYMQGFDEWSAGQNGGNGHAE